MSITLRNAGLTPKNPISYKEQIDGQTNPYLRQTPPLESQSSRRYNSQARLEDRTFHEENVRPFDSYLLADYQLPSSKYGNKAA